MIFNTIKFQKLSSFIGKQTGLYTKKGCINTATEIGKELVDLQKAGKDITVQDFLTLVSQKAPNIKLPNVTTREDEFISLMQKCGLNELQQKLGIIEVLDNKHIGGIFWGKTKGIHIKKDVSIESKLPGAYAHELEHFIEYYNNPQTVIKNIINKLNPIRIKEKAYEKWIQKNLNSPHKEEFIAGEIRKFNSKNKQNLTEELLCRGFGLNKESGIIPETGIIAGYPSSSKGVEEFLKSKAYNGLSDSKRIDAYIRAIIRHFVHPKATNIRTLKQVRNRFYREANAYQVNDNIARYYSDSNELTASKIVSEIHRRAGEIMDNEIKLAKKYRRIELKEHIMENLRKDGKIPKQLKRTGLPTSAVVKTT